MVELCDPLRDHAANPEVRSSVHCKTAPPPETPPVVPAAMPGVESSPDNLDILVVELTVVRSPAGGKEGDDTMS